MATPVVPQFTSTPLNEVDWTASTDDAANLSRKSFSDIDVDEEQELQVAAIERTSLAEGLELSRSKFLKVYQQRKGLKLWLEDKSTLHLKTKAQFNTMVAVPR